MNSKFAKWWFRIAGIYGILVLVPQFFLLSKFGMDNPPSITHPEFYYGFNGVALAFQVVFLIISTNPEKYRVMMIPSMIEKALFVLAVAGLFLTEGMNSSILAGASLDFILLIGFIIAFIKTESRN